MSNSFNDIEIFLPQGPETVRKLVGARLSPKANESADPVLWGAESAGLQNSSLYRSLDHEAKRKTMIHLSRMRIQLALAIEEMGLTYCAKMNLLSRSRDEKVAFSLMAADEAKHLSWLLPFGKIEEGSSARLHAFVKELVQKSDRLTGLFVLQVLLEGFGLHYYRNLAVSTLNPQLKETFLAILQDESFHHGLGIALLETSEKSRLESADPAAIEACEAFLRLISGQGWIVESVEAALGSKLEKIERENLLVETGWHAGAAARTQAIEAMLRRHAPPSWMSELEKRRVFDARA